MVVRILLEPGNAIIFNNQRALHGRESYKVLKVATRVVIVPRTRSILRN